MINPVTLDLHATVTPTTHDAPAVAHAAALFGLDADQSQPLTLVPPLQLTLRPAQLVFITGPSGTGKSTLLRELTTQLKHHDPDTRHIDLDHLPPWPDRPLAEGLPQPLPDDLNTLTHALSRAGLAEAALLLRTPAQLSVGQRFRLRLAHAIALSQHTPPDTRTLLTADEFAAPLDRTTAANLAKTLHRWSRTTHATLVIATAHDDLLEPLQPDTLVHLTPHHQAEVLTR
ncbi:ATP-binding cassette domain-containing protein [Mucisphaera calidilacus]|uniref:2-aminoethylphosphonate import ATP-binding protein PhnT n=1 Tax=Mucisphaera calidilacus TaxID=2527982 RepID=A0A518C0M1_9BACT|nr:ATP-binding cassette domain-containing protein [Mucisphaera calidilacus]QDU72772.1 Putative 2-aminoethylphosphonate import ATP-binding protein PhnT [Mucisphaera calidilacus]